MNNDVIIDTDTITQQDIRNIKLWYLSFVLLGASIMLFLHCFFNDDQLLFFFILATVFVLFIVTYMYASKKITHQDGYTLVQAKSFYKKCEKQNLNIFELAKEYEYAAKLTNEQIIDMYKIGKNLNNK